MCLHMMAAGIRRPELNLSSPEIAVLLLRAQSKVLARGWGAYDPQQLQRQPRDITAKLETASPIGKTFRKILTPPIEEPSRDSESQRTQSAQRVRFALPKRTPRHSERNHPKCAAHLKPLSTYVLFRIYSVNDTSWL